MEDEKGTALLLFNELARQSARPLRVPDLVSYIRMTRDKNVWSELGSMSIQLYDPSEVFVVLNGLQTDGWIKRMGSGYVLTDNGKKSAARKRNKLSPTARDTLHKLAAVA
jgi:hypothetical protein